MTRSQVIVIFTEHIEVLLDSPRDHKLATSTTQRQRPPVVLFHPPGLTRMLRDYLKSLFE